jgi:hypothetical protein
MGGIVAKLVRFPGTLSARLLILMQINQAIIIAKSEPENYPGFGDAIAGILFLGTPHHGSGYARYGYIMAKTANFLVVGLQASRVLGQMRPDLLKTLEKHSPELVATAEDFKKYAADLRIISFVEGKKTLGLNERVSQLFRYSVVLSNSEGCRRPKCSSRLSIRTKDSYARI